MLDASARREASKARSFREDSASLLTPGLVPPRFAPEHRIPGTGWRPGQPERHPTLRMSWGQHNPETEVVVPVVRVVVVAVRRPAVPGVVVPVVPTAAADYAVRARWPPPQINAARAAARVGCARARRTPPAPASAAATAAPSTARSPTRLHTDWPMVPPPPSIVCQSREYWAEARKQKTEMDQPQPPGFGVLRLVAAFWAGGLVTRRWGVRR